MLALISIAFAQQPNYDSVLLVGVDQSPPFSMKNGDKWEGLSVELWERIALEKNIKYKYVEEPFNNILQDVGNCQLDIGLPAITVTSDREALMDFSYPYMIEDVAVATNSKKSGWTIAKVFLRKLSEPILFLLIGLAIASLSYAAFEKKFKNAREMLDSSYWSMTTMTTVGYGDEAPKSAAGRIFAMFWMFIALFFTASINAQIYGVFNEISWTPEIDDLSDLRGREVFTVGGSFSESLLKMNQISVVSLSSEQAMIASLENTSNSFAVYDRSILKYHLHDTDIFILDKGFYQQHLAFAICEGLGVEDINQGILNQVDSSWWNFLISKHLN